VDATQRSSRHFFRRWLGPMLGWLLSLAIPIWLVLSGARLLTTETYLRLEYGKPDFPADPYGFSQQQRLEYATYAIRYLQTDRSIDYLADLTLPSGQPMYNQRELRHMADVKAVVQVAFLVHTALSAVIAVVGLWLYSRREWRSFLRRAIARAGYLATSAIVALILLAVLNWDTFFDTFHRVFFEQGTWRFQYSDTLIRLFPERFWFDAALTLGAWTIMGTILLIVVAWLWGRRTKAEAVASADATASQQG
jgi:integral membrane protein (TIGR01906 family)